MELYQFTFKGYANDDNVHLYTQSFCKPFKNRKMAKKFGRLMMKRHKCLVSFKVKYIMTIVIAVDLVGHEEA